MMKLLLFVGALIYSCNAETVSNEVKENYENGIAAFTVKVSHLLHQAVSKPDENVIFSPFSLFTTLSLTHLAASGETQREIAQALQLSNDNIDVYVYLTEEVLKSIQNSTAAEVIVRENFFLQKGLEVNETFAKVVKGYYGSEVESVDYKSGSGATEYINKWVSSNTKGRIPTLFSSPIEENTIIMLLSTIYFSGVWSHKFHEHQTSKGKFNTGVEDVEVHFLNSQSHVPYTNNPTLQYEAIALDYADKEFSIFIVLPYKNHDIQSFTHHLKAEDLQSLIKAATNNLKYVDYKIPRMKVKWEHDFKDVLTSLGVKHLFENADLSRLIVASNVTVSKVKHATEIEVDENGTVATAAVAVQILVTSVGVPDGTNDSPVQFYVDRPFTFFVYHHNTKTFLFSGMIHHPYE